MRARHGAIKAVVAAFVVTIVSATNVAVGAATSGSEQDVHGTSSMTGHHSAISAGSASATHTDGSAHLRPPGRPGTIAYNRWLGRTFNDTLLNEDQQSRRVAILRRIVSPDYVQHNPLAPEGRAGLVAFIPAIYASFPDVRFTVRDVIATKTRVVTRWTWRGTLSGEPFLGVPARGQRVEFDAIDIWTVRDGKLYEHWDQFDWTRAIHQLTDDDKLPQAFVDAAERPVDR